MGLQNISSDMVLLCKKKDKKRHFSVLNLLCYELYKNPCFLLIWQVMFIFIKKMFFFFRKLRNSSLFHSYLVWRMERELMYGRPFRPFFPSLRLATILFCSSSLWKNSSPPLWIVLSVFFPLFLKKKMEKARAMTVQRCRVSKKELDKRCVQNYLTIQRFGKRSSFRFALFQGPRIEKWISRLAPLCIFFIPSGNFFLQKTI